MIQCHDSLCEDAHFVGKDRWVKLIGLWRGILGIHEAAFLNPGGGKFSL